MTKDEQAAWDRFAAAALGGVVNRILYDQSVEDEFVKGGNDPIELPGFAAMHAAMAADAMIAERRKRVNTKVRQ